MTNGHYPEEERTANILRDWLTMISALGRVALAAMLLLDRDEDEEPPEEEPPEGTE